jgi:hypothetical protein
MFCREAECPESRRVGSKFVCHDAGWREALLLEQLSHQSFCRFRIAPALYEEVQNFAFTVTGAPKPVAFSPDDDDHFIKVPVIAGPQPSPAQIGSDGRSKLQEPVPDSFIGNIHASFSKQILDITETKRESRIEPDRMANDARWETATLE